MPLDKPQLRERTINPYTYTEVKTNEGQLLQIVVNPRKVQLVKKVLAWCVRSIIVPVTHKINVQHGAYGRYSRYDIKQHKYAGGHGGYIELLEIKNPPNNRQPFVINNYSVSGGSHFTEWETLESAQNGFELIFNQREKLKDQPGFIRKVPTGALTPWFYAVGDQDLAGDYAVPADMQEDSYYTLGEKFVVFDNGLPRVATCLGTRFIAKHYSMSPGFWHRHRDEKERVETFRLVYFSDGYVWDERTSIHSPRPVEGNEAWVGVAIEQFKDCLAGKRSDVNVKFTDGTQFSGSFKSSRLGKYTKAGDYLMRATVRHNGKTKVKEGWVEGFTPSEDHPDVISFVTAKMQGEIESLEVLRYRLNKEVSSKAWSGMFFKGP